MLSGPVGQRKRLKLFRVIWEQPFPCQKIYLASQRNYEHHFILTLRLWRGVTIVAWVSTSYIGGNSSTNLLAIHIYYHLYPQYIRHHFWRRRCMKRTLVCAFAVTRDKKNYNEKQEYKQHHYQHVGTRSELTICSLFLTQMLTTAEVVEKSGTAEKSYPCPSCSKAG